MIQIQTCTLCGAVNGAEASVCCFCDARLFRKNNKDIPVPTDLPAVRPDDLRSLASAESIIEDSLAAPPDWDGADWHSEVSDRLRAYRVRSRKLRADLSQPEFPFDDSSVARGRIRPPQPREEEVDKRASEDTGLDPRHETREESPAETPGEENAPPLPARSKPRRHRPLAARAATDRFEIDVTQSSLDFEAAEWRAAESPILEYDASSFSVASLAERRRAGLIDAALLLFAYGGFLALFCALGGHFTFSKLDAAVTAATMALFYAQYFLLFTLFGGATPGMMVRGLRVVSFDGSGPTARQLFWRGMGYLVSGGIALLGFLWAVWDAHHLTWQDHISRTYLARLATLDAGATLDDTAASVSGTPANRF